MGGSYASGYEFYTAVNGGSTALTTGVEYFDKPKCTEVTPQKLWKCQQYQPAVGKEADGRPRFNAPSPVEWTATVGFINTANFDAIKSYMKVSST